MVPALAWIWASIGAWHAGWPDTPLNTPLLIERR